MAHDGCGSRSSRLAHAYVAVEQDAQSGEGERYRAMGIGEGERQSDRLGLRTGCWCLVLCVPLDAYETKYTTDIHNRPNKRLLLIGTGAAKQTKTSCCLMDRVRCLWLRRFQ